MTTFFFAENVSLNMIRLYNKANNRYFLVDRARHDLSFGSEEPKTYQFRSLAVSVISMEDHHSKSSVDRILEAVKARNTVIVCTPSELILYCRRDKGKESDKSVESTEGTQGIDRENPELYGYKCLAGEGIEIDVFNTPYVCKQLDEDD